MIDPMTKFAREDIKEFKVCYIHSTKLKGQNQRRDFIRVQERYEELVSRYASQSKSKEPSTIRDVKQLSHSD